MDDWPSAPRTGHSFQICSSSPVMFPHCWGRGGLPRQSFLSDSCHSEVLSWSHLMPPAFQLSPFDYLFHLQLSSSVSPSPLDPSPQVRNTLPMTSWEMPFSFLLIPPHPPCSFTNHLLERAQPFPRSHMLASNDWPVSSPITTGWPGLSRGPQEASVRTWG